jgi:hypothetical protein
MIHDFICIVATLSVDIGLLYQFACATIPNRLSGKFSPFATPLCHETYGANAGKAPKILNLYTNGCN